MGLNTSDSIVMLAFVDQRQGNECRLCCAFRVQKADTCLPCPSSIVSPMLDFLLLMTLERQIRLAKWRSPLRPRSL